MNTLFYLYFPFLPAMEGVYSYYGAVHIGTGIVGFERKFGYVSGITSIDTSQFRSYDMQKGYHPYDCG